MLKIPSQLPFKIKFLSRLKQIVYKSLKNNTDYWIVQTENTKNELVKHLDESEDRVMIIPYYSIVGSSNDGEIRDGYVYASNYNPHKNFEFVVDAWAEMAKHGIKPKLNLTIGRAPEEFYKKLNAAKESGADIINHGTMPQHELFSLYRQCKALVYASINESLGLCLIEAIENGCDVIAPELPYVHSICKPSGTFSLKNMGSLIQVITQYETGDNHKTELKVNNQINKMLEILS